MSQPYVGEIRVVGFTFAPTGWALCDGSLLNIATYPELFTLLSTTFGGDGLNTFGLPNFQGRVGIGSGQGPGLSGYTVGESGGEEEVALSTQMIPSHSHGFIVSTNNGSTPSPDSGTYADLPASGTSENLYGAIGSLNGTASKAIMSASGDGQPHENRPPTLCLAYIIAIEGIYPSF